MSRLARRVAVALDPNHGTARPEAASARPPETSVNVAASLLAVVPASLRKDARVLVFEAGDGAAIAAFVEGGYAGAEGWIGEASDVAEIRLRYQVLRDTVIHSGPAEAVFAQLADDHFSLAIVPLTAESTTVDGSVWPELARVSSDIITVGPADATDHVAELVGASGMTGVSNRPWPDNATGLQQVRIVEFRRMERLSTLREFWRQPTPEGNHPSGYIGPIGRSRALAEIIADLPLEARILEIGCNVGRNLAYLYDQGYERVEGIEINPNAIALLRKTYPQLASTPIHEGPAGEQLPKFADDEFDLIFTMAVIEHLHPDEAATVFDDMVRVGKQIVAIEPLGRITHRQFPHDVPAVFQQRGLTMVLSKPMSEFPSNADDAAMKAFTAWRFRRDE
jgi:SAM-dependent methyltransferase